MGFIRKLRGEDATKASVRAASLGQLQDFEFNGPGGATSSFDPETGVANTDLGDLGGIREALLTAFPDQFGAGNQQVNGQVGLEGNPFAEAAQSRLSGATRDFGALAAERLRTLRGAARPQEQRAVNSTVDRLCAGGRLGTTGGANVLEALANSENQADLGRQIAAQDFASTQQARDTSAVGSLLSGALSTAGLDERNAGRAINERDSAFSRALASLQGTTDLNGLGISQFNAGLQAAATRSNAANVVASNIQGAEFRGADRNAGFIGGLTGGLAGGIASLFNDED